MAVTKKDSIKSRLDFAQQLEEALYVDQKDNQANEQNEIAVTNVVEQPVEYVVETNEPMRNFKLGNTMDEDFGNEDDELFLSIAKGSRGVQRSIYFENDVYQYIKQKSERYNANFSNVVNLLLKEMIYKNRK